MATVRARLTKRLFDAAQPIDGRDHEVWDTDLKGFCLRVTAKGSRSYALKYRIGSAQRWLTIGKHGSPWTPDTGREAAREALEQVAKGHDPAVAKRQAREALTVSALIDRYLEDGPVTKPAKREITWKNDASNLNRHVRPLIGRRLAHSVTQAEAARVIRDIVEGKTACVQKTGPRGVATVKGGEHVARRTRTTAAACWAWGLQQTIITGTNPFAAVKLSVRPVRERFLSPDEAGRFLAKLDQMEADGLVRRVFADAMRLLLLSGARKTEVTGLRWAEVDFHRRVATLPPDRTKAGGTNGARHIHLSPPAMAILERRRAERDTLADEERSPFVLPAERGEGHVIDVRRVHRVCAAARLEGLRVHDLRHSFASLALANGASLFLIGKALGHANARTTERYAHLSGDPLAELAASVAVRIIR